MFKGFIMLAPISLIGILGLKRYIDNDELAECENFGVAGELATKKVQLENQTEKDENLENLLTISTESQPEIRKIAIAPAPLGEHRAIIES